MNSWKASERRYPYSLAVSRLSRAIDALHAEREALPQYHPLQDLYHTVKRNFLPMLAASFVLIGALGGPLDYLLASRGHKERMAKLEEDAVRLERQRQRQEARLQRANDRLTELRSELDELKGSWRLAPARSRLLRLLAAPLTPHDKTQSSFLPEAALQQAGSASRVPPSAPSPAPVASAPQAAQQGAPASAGAAGASRSRPPGATSGGTTQSSIRGADYAEPPPRSRPARPAPFLTGSGGGRLPSPPSSGQSSSTMTARPPADERQEAAAMPGDVVMKKGPLKSGGFVI